MYGYILVRTERCDSGANVYGVLGEYNILNHVHTIHQRLRDKI